MPEYALSSSPDHWNGRLQNSHLGGVITAAGSREVVRCPGCLLVQFRTISDLCRRCAKSLPQPPHPEEAAERGNGMAIAPVSVACSTKKGASCGDPHPRGEIARKLALGYRIRKLRRLRNWTQEQMAAKADVPRSYISRIEHAHLLPGPSMARRLAEALGVGILDLFQDKGNENSHSGSSMDPFWNVFACHFRQLDTNQKASVLYRVRAMLCERLQQQHHSVPPALENSSRPLPHAIAV
jgi:transcriptional regulator with XRE-family HTH domain